MNLKLKLAPQLRRLSLGIVLLTLGALAAQAQPAGQITGQLLDERHQPLPFATVLLRQTGDTAWVRGEVAKADGRYTFANVVPNHTVRPRSN